MSYTQIYYHIIFSTKNRIPALHATNRKKLYNYLWSIFKAQKCHLYQIGGTNDHIHILSSIHPTCSLSNFIRDLKTSSGLWIKKERIFAKFPGWQNEYGAFTKSFSHRRSLIEYIKNQEHHHKHESFLDEFKRLLNEEGVTFNEKYLY